MADEDNTTEERDRRFPMLLPNIRKILAADNDIEVAKALGLHRSNVSKWAELERVGLYHCTPFLKVMTFEELALQDVSGTINDHRGWTRDPELAAKGPGQPGPVLMKKHVETEGALSRIKFMLGFTDAEDDVGEMKKLIERRGRAWRTRRTIPDYVYHDLYEDLKFSITYMLMGGDGDDAVAKMREARAQRKLEVKEKCEGDDREPEPRG